MTDNQARESGATDEEIRHWDVILTSYADDPKAPIQISASVLKRILTRLNLERRRADQAEQSLDALAAVVRTDAGDSQRRREIWQVFYAMMGGHTSSAKHYLTRAIEVHADFTAALDAEKGGGE